MNCDYWYEYLRFSRTKRHPLLRFSFHRISILHHQKTRIQKQVLEFASSYVLLGSILVVHWIWSGPTELTLYQVRRLVSSTATATVETESTLYLLLLWLSATWLSGPSGACVWVAFSYHPTSPSRKQSKLQASVIWTKRTKRFRYRWRHHSNPTCQQHTHKPGLLWISDNRTGSTIQSTRYRILDYL